MIVARSGLVCLALVALLVVAPIASSAFAEDSAALQAKKTPAHAKRPKSAATAPSQSGALKDINFSDPYAPPVGTAQAPKSDLAPAGNGPPKEPVGSISPVLKWHASNAPKWLYENVVPHAGPDGPGDAIQAGVKLGFLASCQRRDNAVTRCRNARTAASVPIETSRRGAASLK